MNYEKMYTILFNSITESVDEIVKTPILTEEVAKGLYILREAQKSTENMYIEESEQQSSDE